MAANLPKPKNQLSPNHVRVMRSLLSKSRLPSSMDYHPLMVPPQSGQSPFGNDDQMIPAKTGEYVVPQPVVQRKGSQFFDNIVKKTLGEIMPPDQASQGGTGTPATGYQVGGTVGEPWWSEPEDINQNLNFGPPSTTAYGGIPGNNFMTNWRNFYGEPAPGLYRLANMGLGKNGWNNWSNMGYWGGGWNPGMAYGAPYGYGSPTQNLGTMIPTFWDSQGFPFAVPVGGWFPSPSNPQAGAMPVGNLHIGQHLADT